MFHRFPSYQTRKTIERLSYCYSWLKSSQLVVTGPQEMKPLFLLITILMMIWILCPAGRAQRPLASFLNSLYSSAWFIRRSSTTTSSSLSELSTSANTVTETITLTETTTVNWIERIETTLSSVQVKTYCSSVMKESQPSPSVLASIVDKVHNILAWVGSISFIIDTCTK